MEVLLDDSMPYRVVGSQSWIRAWEAVQMIEIEMHIDSCVWVTVGN